MLVGRKLKEKAVDAVLDKVNLPDPVENAIKVAVTGNVGDLLGDAGKDTAKETLLGGIMKKVKKK
jgi:hypothetical protein